MLSCNYTNFCFVNAITLCHIILNYNFGCTGYFPWNSIVLVSLIDVLKLYSFLVKFTKWTDCFQKFLAATLSENKSALTFLIVIGTTTTFKLPFFCHSDIKFTLQRCQAMYSTPAKTLWNTRRDIRIRFYNIMAAPPLLDGSEPWVI